MIKRTPHKGGRTAQLTIRLTPEEKTRLQTAARKAGMNVTDYIVLLVKRQDHNK